MNEEQKEFFGILENKLIEIHFDFQLFRQLFGNDPQNIQLMNKVAPGCFATFQKVLLHEIYMLIGKFLDPPKTSGQDNLTIDHFIDLVKDQIPPELMNELRDDIERVKQKSSNLRTLRHKVLAHSDLDYAKRISYGTVDGVLLEPIWKKS